ncbi:MAG: PorT family protein [Bacteroidetes bacterium]|nr:PorT family protein [Bacteroidota bacterium]
MKKVILTLAVFTLCFSIAGFAQRARVAITGGLNAAKITRSISGYNQSGEYKIGLITGMMLEAPICKKGNFSFQPDLRYTQKGTAEQLLAPVVRKYTALRYAELATNFVYNVKDKKHDATFYLGAGPFLALPLPSKKVEHTAGSPNVNTDISWGNLAANDYKGVDYGADFTMGYRNKHGVFVAFNYTQGARNLVPSAILDIPGSERDKVKNMSFALRVGYLFPGSSKK